MEFFSTRNKILSINPNGLRSTSIQLRERIWNVFYKEEYDYYDTLEYTSYTTGIEDMMLEMGIKYEFPANKIYKNQNAEKLHKHVKKNNLWAATEAFNKVEETVDIQDVLGEQSGIDNKFEVFLSVKGLEYYKYRIMFLRYGAIAYPVEVVLNEDIAEAYNGKKQYIYDVDSMEELKTMFETIINTDFCTNLIQSLIYESMRQSRKDKSEN